MNTNNTVELIDNVTIENVTADIHKVTDENDSVTYTVAFLDNVYRAATKDAAIELATALVNEYLTEEA